MDEVARCMQELTWTYPEQDRDALARLEQRITETGRREQVITYSDLVSGVVFRLPGVRGGAPFEIEEWTGLDRAIIGEFLGYISMRSYLEAGFMASALVVSRNEYRPSEHFFRWMETLGVLPDTGRSTVDQFWSEQLKLAFAYYTSTDPGRRRRRPLRGAGPKQ